IGVRDFTSITELGNGVGHRVTPPGKVDENPPVMRHGDARRHGALELEDGLEATDRLVCGDLRCHRRPPQRAWRSHHRGDARLRYFSRGSSASRSPSPKRLKPSTVTKIARPGNS